MKKNLVLLTVLLMAAACAPWKDDIWTLERALNEQEKALEEQEKALKEQQAQILAEQERLAILEGKYDGFKKSDTPFGIINMGVSADTVSKSLDFKSMIRVNPSGVPFTKEMLMLDALTTTRFFPVEPDTKASYVKAPEHFSLKSFEADKNAAGETLDGQYNLTIATAAQEIIWEDVNMAFVGAYVDKENKTQYVSTAPFPIVMMPLPGEGLDTWVYPKASFFITRSQEDEAGNPELVTELGKIYMALDHTDFETRDKEGNRRYSADFLSSATFVPEDGQPAVKAEFIKEEHCISFEPDTTGDLAWREFADSTGIKQLSVKGNVTLNDRWGGSSVIPVTLTWFNTTSFTAEVKAKLSDIKDNIYKADLAGIFKEVGVELPLEKKARCVSNDVYWAVLDTNPAIDGMYEDGKENRIFTMDILKDSPLAVGDEAGITCAFVLTANPSDIHPTFARDQIQLKYKIHLTIVE